MRNNEFNPYDPASLREASHMDDEDIKSYEEKWEKEDKVRRKNEKESERKS